MKSLKKFACVLVAAIVFSGCALLKKKPEKIEVVEVPTSKKEIILLAKKYEQERQFKKALNALKEARRLDPGDDKIEARIARLETGLDNAVKRHLKSGRYFLQKGDRGKAKKEFLLVLFLDPEQRAALNYLRELAGVPVSRTIVRKVPPKTRPDVKSEDYTVHTLKSGESLSILALQYYGDKMKYDIIAEFNNITDINNVRVGQKIKIPAAGKKPLDTERKEEKAPAPEPPAPPAPVEVAEAPEPEAAVEPESEPAEPVAEDDQDSALLDEIKEAEKALDYSKEEMLEQAEDEEGSQVAKLDYKFLEVTLDNAEKLFKDEQYSDAAAEYQKIIDMQPEHPTARDMLETSEKIASSLKKGDEYYMSRKYGKAYDEFDTVLELRPDSAVAKKKIEQLITPMITEANYLLYDEQSPCRSIDLIKKILEKEPQNKSALELMDEAAALEEGLELKCGDK